MAVLAAPEELDVDGRWGRLRARRWGSRTAPLVVGVPGLTGTSEHLAFLAERIAGPGLQFVAVDLRGRGHSESTAAGTYGWEHHAVDLLDLAGVLGADRFSIVGQSMGGSVGMKVAELRPSRLQSLTLIDVAGSVDPGVGPVIARTLARVGRRYDSPEQYIAALRSSGVLDRWNDHVDRAVRYGLCDDSGGVRMRASPAAVAEDRSYTATQDAYRRWAHLTMPTLLVRATQQLAPGAGYVVPARDRDRFLQDVATAEVVEIDANHLTINTHPDLPPAILRFLRGAVPG